MSTVEEARDAIMLIVQTGWDADPLTAPLTLLYDDVRGGKPGFDANGEAVPYGRVTVRHLTGGEETLGPKGQGKEEHTGNVVVQCFAPKNDGFQAVDRIAQVVKDFLQRARFTDGWLFNVHPREQPATGPWNQINVNAEFRYTETS